MNSSERIPFSVDISRVIEVLATQIYQSPLALLRENTQNSFDAILLRRAKDDVFAPLIKITIDRTSVTVQDNGIGMTRQQLRNNYWQAGSSSKNTPEARAAGVVGTFGIGAMANFGIAESLVVETEALAATERITCRAKRSTLSATDDCIDFESIAATGVPGTCVTATLAEGQFLDVGQATAYISEFVRFLGVRVEINGDLHSGRPFAELVPELPRSWSFEGSALDLGRGYTGDISITGAANGEVRAEVANLKVGIQDLPGQMIVRQGSGALRTFRSGFGLAATTVHSVYSLGGIADFLFLQPTAGREALSTDSMRVLQELMANVDDLISIKLSEQAEANSSTSFMSWVVQRGRYELCRNLRLQCAPGSDEVLAGDIQDSPNKNWLAYQGNDPSTLSHASEDRALLVLSRSNPRRQCEHEFLTRYCQVSWMTDVPRVHRELHANALTLAHKGFAFRLSHILATDYFVQADVRYGDISHDLPVLAEANEGKLTIWLLPQGVTVKLILSLYSTEHLAFDSMSKDFVRTVIFPRIADHVPSSTRQGAEAFLKTVQRTRETFEYEASDLESLHSIWEDYIEGKISMAAAAEKSATITAKTVQVIEPTATATVSSVVPDVVENAATLSQNADANTGSVAERELARPPIQRLEISTDRKVLVIPEAEPPLNGFRCFLAISDSVKADRGDYFLQPHRTSVIWGGQRALFVFEHHSGEFGLYYDIQAQELVSASSGGGSFVTSTLVLKNRIFIPVPPEIQAAFIPHDSERKRLQVKCDLLFVA